MSLPQTEYESVRAYAEVIQDLWTLHPKLAIAGTAYVPAGDLPDDDDTESEVRDTWRVSKNWGPYELRTNFRLGGPIGNYIGFWGDLLRDILQGSYV